MTTIDTLLAAEELLAEVDCILYDFVAAGTPRCDARRDIDITARGTGLFDVDGEWHCCSAQYVAAVAS